MSSDIRTSSILLKVLYDLLVLYLEGMANSELLDVDNSTCRSHMSDFRVNVLVGIMTSFHMQDYFNIDEVLTFSKEDLMGDSFGMSGGNAMFLLIQVDDEMHCLERASGMRRRA